MSTDPYLQYIPHFNSTGKHSLCIWYEHNEGHHIIIAKDEAQVLSSLRPILRKEPDLSLKQYWDVEIVLPPEVIIKRFAENSYAKELIAFRGWVMYLAKSYQKVYKALPDGFNECLEFKRSAEEEEYYRADDRDGNELSNKYHIGCVNCDAHKITTTLNMLELYNTHKQLYRQEGSAPYTRKKRVSFDGLAYDPAKSLYAVVLNGGHHSPGVCIEEVAETYEAQDNTLFFFSGALKPMPKSLSQCVVEFGKEYEENEKRKKSIMKDRTLNEDLKRAQTLKTLLALPTERTQLLTALVSRAILVK